MASNKKLRQQQVQLKIMQLLQVNATTRTGKLAREIGIFNGLPYHCVMTLIDKINIMLKNYASRPFWSKHLYKLTTRGIKKKL